MPYTFLGHGPVGGTLIYKGTTYRVGDSVPMTKAEAEHHVAAGLSFEGLAAASGRVAAPPTPPDTRPRDDRGAVIPDAPTGGTATSK